MRVFSRSASSHLDRVRFGPIAWSILSMSERGKDTLTTSRRSRRLIRFRPIKTPPPRWAPSIHNRQHALQFGSLNGWPRTLWRFHDIEPFPLCMACGNSCLHIPTYTAIYWMTFYGHPKLAIAFYFRLHRGIMETHSWASLLPQVSGNRCTRHSSWNPWVKLSCPGCFGPAASNLMTTHLESPSRGEV